MTDQLDIFGHDDMRKALASAQRAWRPWLVQPPLAGCGPLTAANLNPYWPAYVSAWSAWWFDIGGFQQAWCDAWTREYRRAEA